MYKEIRFFVFGAQYMAICVSGDAHITEKLHHYASENWHVTCVNLPPPLKQTQQ